MDQARIDIVKVCAEELLTDLGVDFSVIASSLEGEDGVMIDITSENHTDQLIGYHAETLNALQLFIGIMAEKKIGEWTKVIVNIGGYRQKREAELKELAMNLAQKATFSGVTQEAVNLSASERRIVHMALADHPDVFTVSEGEGRDRRLYIKPKTAETPVA